MRLLQGIRIEEHKTRYNIYLPLSICIIPFPKKKFEIHEQYFSSVEFPVPNYVKWKLGQVTCHPNYS